MKSVTCEKCGTSVAEWMMDGHVCLPEFDVDFADDEGGGEGVRLRSVDHQCAAVRWAEEFGGDIVDEAYQRGVVVFVTKIATGERRRLRIIAEPTIEWDAVEVPCA